MSVRRARRTSTPGVRLIVAGAVVGVLTSCGQGGALPAGGEPQPVGSGDAGEPASTTLPLFPSDTPGEPPLAGETQLEGDTDDSIDGDSDRPGSSVAVPSTATDWVDVTANLVGLDSTCGNVSFVSVHPILGDVVVGISNHGLWDFDENTVAWTPLGAGPDSAEIRNRTSWIEYDPVAPERYWEAGAYGDGIFRTDDAGQTFQRVGELTHLDNVSVDPTDPSRSTMLAGGHERRAVYRSLDAGQSWTDISELLPPDIGFTAYPIVLDAETYLLGTYRADESGIFKTQDAGATWTRVHEGPVAGPPLVDDGQIAWLRRDGAGIAFSDDAGSSFSVGAPTGGAPMSLHRLADGRLVSYDRSNLLVADATGEAWTGFGPELPFEPRGIAVTPDASAVYAWQFTCNFEGDDSNPVLPMSIVRLELNPDE